MTASTGNVPGRIFMSYRREDTAYPAGWLYARLASHFTRDQIFKDIDSIELGDDFVEVITTAVSSCDVLLALIGDRWLTVTGQDGRRRLDNPDDFVRLEIEAALARDVRVIPILVEGARMPRADELPTSVAKLARRQALELSPSRFDVDSQRLLRVLERTITEAQEHARKQAEEAAARQRRQVEQPSASTSPQSVSAVPANTPPHDTNGRPSPDMRSGLSASGDSGMPRLAEPAAGRAGALARRTRQVSPKTLAVGAAAAAVTVALVLLALLLPSPGPKPALVSAAQVVAPIRPDRLTMSLIDTPFATGDLPAGTSASATPQLSDSLTSLSSTTDNQPEATGLVATVAAAFAGPGAVGARYYVFSDPADASSYFGMANPFPAGYRPTGSFAPSGIGDQANCGHAAGTAGSASWGCLTLSANVVTYSWVTGTGTGNGDNLESALAVGMLRHLRSVAAASPTGPPPQPPGPFLDAGLLFQQLLSVYPTALVPAGLGSPLTTAVRQAPKYMPSGLEQGKFIRVSFSGSGPDFDSSRISFYVFDTVQDAQSWFGTGNITPIYDNGTRLATPTDELPFPTSGFSSSEDARCNTYSEAAVGGFSAEGVSHCSVLWGDIVVSGVTEKAAFQGPGPSTADSNMAVTLAHSALLRLVQVLQA